MSHECPRKEEVPDDCKSMYEKVGDMNGLALWMLDDANKFSEQLKNKFGEDKVSRYWGIADGLDEKFIMKRIHGECSLAALLEPVENLEQMIDDNLTLLKEIEKFLEECNKIEKESNVSG